MPRARLVAALLASVAAAARAGAAPPVPWTAAHEHVRRLVTLEGVVARATATGDRRCVLEFDPDDPAALRVVLILPFVTDLPADPSRLYQGKRVQVTGRVMRFQKRLEMLVTPAQLEVVGLATASTPAPATAPPAAGTIPAPVAATDPRCRAWRDEWTAIRGDLRALTARLEECLAAGRSGCAPVGDRLGVPLSRLAAVEAHLDRHCP